MTKRMAIALMTLLIAGVSTAAELPPGKWWRNPHVAKTLVLDAAQQERLDGIFRDSANDLIDLRAEVEKRAIALRAALDQRELNRQELQRLAAALTQARGRLFERELMMLADMRGVLDDEQWATLREHLERRKKGAIRRRR